jgi:excisionase family DNA binding protein
MINQLSSGWMTITEAAKHIGMSVAFLRKCVRQRRVPFARIGTKALRFRREDLDHWLESTGSAGEVNHAERGQ